MDFSLLFSSKSGLAWVGFYFKREKKILKKPNTLVYAQVLVVTCWKLNSDKCLLRSPTTWRDFLGQNGLKTLKNSYCISKITPSHQSRKIWKYNGKLFFWFLKILILASEFFFNCNNIVLFLRNLLLELILELGKCLN